MKESTRTRLGCREFLRYSSVAVVAGFLTVGAATTTLAAEESINFNGWSAAVDLVESHITAFEKKTGIEVEYGNLPWAQYRDAMVTKFVGKAPLDVMWVSDAWLPEWAEAGWIQPVDQFKELTKYNSDVDKFCTDSMTYKGQQYGLTYYTDYMGFFYNEEMLKKAGIAKPPETWAEVVEQSLKIKQAGLSEYPLMLAMANESWLIEFLSAMVFSQGGVFTDDAGNAIMQDPKKGAVEALKWVVEAVQRQKIVSPATVETGELAGLKSFAAGNHAFALEPKYRLRMLNDPKQSQVAGKVKQILMPKGPNGSHATVGWMRFYGVSKHALENPERAKNVVKFVEWFGGKAEGEYRFQKFLLTDIGAGFCTRPLFDDPDIRASYAQYAKIDIIAEQQRLARKKDVITPWFGEWNEFNGAMWQSAILDQISPEEALKKSADKWQTLKREQ